MPSDGADEVKDDVQEDGVEQTEQVQAPETQDQASDTVGTAGEIVVGNQRFATSQDLVKAYSELQKGKTQSDQRHSDQIKAYESLRKYLTDLQKDQAQWTRFVDYVQGKNQTATQSAQPKAADDPFRAETSRQLEETQARLDWFEFKGAHPELSEDDRKEVVRLVDEQFRKGVDLSLEHAYKLWMYDRNAAKLVSSGQKKAEDAIVKGKQATSLGSAPGTGQGAKQAKKRYFELKEGDKNKRILEILKAKGVSFDDEE